MSASSSPGQPVFAVLMTPEDGSPAFVKGAQPDEPFTFTSQALAESNAQRWVEGEIVAQVMMRTDPAGEWTPVGDLKRAAAPSRVLLDYDASMRAWVDARLSGSGPVEYAVEMLFENGSKTLVMHEDPFEPITFTDLAEANRHAQAWNGGRSRVVALSATGEWIAVAGCAETKIEYGIMNVIYGADAYMALTEQIDPATGENLPRTYSKYADAAQTALDWSDARGPVMNYRVMMRVPGGTFVSA